MTLRAFIIGLTCVVGLCLLDPLTSFNKGWGWNTVGHFPPGAVFFLVLLTVGGNLLIKLVRRAWALRQAELMLVWCMLLVASIVPSDGLMRWFLPMLAGPSYVGRRADIAWQETSLEHAPEPLLLTKSLKSVAVTQFYEGHPEGWDGRIPWGLWAGPVLRWGLFMLFFYLAVFFICGILRRQWVDRERLQFPLARVPLEFTEGSAGEGWLPRLLRNKAFLLGVVCTLAFRLLRDLPLLFGADGGWNVPVPLKDLFHETPLEQLSFQNFEVWWGPVGFAYLVPADVSLSIWFFYLFGRFELQTSHWLGGTAHQGGTWSALMNWQIAGSYLIFTLGTLFMARRHLLDVARKALGLARGLDDSAEPVSYGVGFWGLLICTAGSVWWFFHYGMKLWVAVIYFGLLMSIMIVNARLVAQSGLYITTCLWRAPNVLHGLGFGRVFGAEGIIVSQMQEGIMIASNYSFLSPAAIHSFRISEAMDRYRKLLLPALVVALFAGIGASTYTCLRMSYGGGAANFQDSWGATGNPKYVFDVAHQKMERPSQVEKAHWRPFGIGLALTGFVMFMRARFYWWPIHPIGLLAISNWHADRIWLPFFLGWLTKVALMKFGSGRIVRQARFFFIGLILVETFVGGVSTIVRTLTRGAVPGF
jgi:hypothetical protein